MTRRKKEISFDADWKEAMWFEKDIIERYCGTVCIRLSGTFFYVKLSEFFPFHKRIIRALGKKAGKIRITLERVE